MCYWGLHGQCEVMVVILLCLCPSSKLLANSELQVAGKSTINSHITTAELPMIKRM